MEFNWDNIKATKKPGNKNKTGETNNSTFLDVEAYLEKYNHRLREIKPHGGSFMYVLEECVFDASHRGGESAIIQGSDGMLLYQCFHDSCKGRTWKEARKIISGNDRLKDSAATSDDDDPIDINKYLCTTETIVEEYNHKYVRIPFAGNNLYSLESSMGGGFAGGRLYIFGGIPSGGKTLLLNNIADNICLNDYPVLFFSYDDGQAELIYRTFARFSEYNIEDFNLRLVENIEAVSKNTNIQKILSNKYIIEDDIPVEKWAGIVDRAMKIHGKNPVIVIDYLRKLRTDSKTTEERLRVDDIIGKLTALAKDKNIPVVTISELARDSYKSGQRLSMASFKETGGIEYEASWLGILAAVEETENGEYKIKENWENIIEHDGNVDLIVFKAKRGTGSTGKIQLKVDKDKMTVTDRCNGATKSRSVKKSQFGF